MIVEKILQEKAPFQLPTLPFGKTDLMPFMSSETFEYHHEKHHKTYVDNLNNLIKETPFASKTLGEIILETAGKTEFAGIFNNAAQVFNHTFFWNSMKKNGGGQPDAKLIELINKSFGNLENFKAEFKKTGIAQFGSGWAWLVLNKETGNLEIKKTPNAETPLISKNLTLLATADVWEHAYYVDYRNKRMDYLDIFLNNLINWDFINQNIGN
jgi:Fe-Mn family superoxide dismutase